MVQILVYILMTQLLLISFSPSLFCSGSLFYFSSYCCIAAQLKIGMLRTNLTNPFTRFSFFSCIFIETCCEYVVFPSHMWADFFQDWPSANYRSISWSLYSVSIIYPRDVWDNPYISIKMELSETHIQSKTTAMKRGKKGGTSLVLLEHIKTFQLCLVKYWY